MCHTANLPACVCMCVCKDGELGRKKKKQERQKKQVWWRGVSSFYLISASKVLSIYLSVFLCVWGDLVPLRVAILGNIVPNLLLYVKRHLRADSCHVTSGCSKPSPSETEVESGSAQPSLLLVCCSMRWGHCQHWTGGGGGERPHCGRRPMRCQQCRTCRGVLCQMAWLHSSSINAPSMGLFSPLNSRAGRHSALSPQLFPASKSPLSDWPFLCRADSRSVPNTPPQYVYKKKKEKKKPGPFARVD